jgi:hypothetical protein
MDQAPQASGVEDCVGRGSGRMSRRLTFAITALVCVLLPYLVAWALLESPLMDRIEEPPNALATPNPQKAPFPFVTQTQEIMMYTNPRLALFAARWTWIVYTASLLWALATWSLSSIAARGRPAQRVCRCQGWIAASLIVGAFLAWPWLAVLLCARWLGP